MEAFLLDPPGLVPSFVSQISERLTRELAIQDREQSIQKTRESIDGSGCCRQSSRLALTGTLLVPPLCLDRPMSSLALYYILGSFQATLD